MNELKHLDEFQDLLANYQLSAHGKAVLSRVKLAVLLAPSSSGRNTIINELVKGGRYQFIVSDTTRQPRSNNGVMEKDGIEYWFRSEESVLEDIKSGEFLEAEIIHEQQVSGISIRELEKAATSEKTAITDADLGGVKKILELKDDAFAFLVLPPSFDEWLRRLTERGQMSNLEIARRLRTAIRIFDYAKSEKRLKLVVNDDLEEAVRCVDQNITGKRSTDTIRKQEVVQLLGRLTESTKKYLATIS